jgi:uncharacterized iron-regulated protein
MERLRGNPVFYRSDSYEENQKNYQLQFPLFKRVSFLEIISKIKSSEVIIKSNLYR